MPVATFSEGAGSVSFSFGRPPGPTNQTVSRRITFSSGTAISGLDFNGYTQTLFWGPNQFFTQTLSLPIIDDNVYEGPNPETFILTNDPSHDFAFTVEYAIEDNDPVPTVRIGSAGSATEGNAVQFTLVLSNPSYEAITVRLDTFGTDAEPGDWDSTALFVTFSPGETVKSVDVATSDDLINEPDEHFRGTLSVVGGTAIPIGSATDTATITDDDPNHPPVAVDDALGALEDTPATYPAAALVGNDTDADGHALTISSVSGAVGGSVVLNPNGSVTFTPDPGFIGAASFDYEVSDGQDTDLGTATINVAAVNDAPTATIAPGGFEVQVNTTTANDQISARAAPLPGGGYVVVWSSTNQDGSGIGVYARRYDASGVPLGGEVQVNTSTAGDQAAPAVSALSDGGYVVTWFAPDASGQGVFAQRYDSDGVPQGGETQVNTHFTNDQHSQSVAGLAGGGYVVAWQSLDQDGSSWGVYARRFDASGAPQGVEQLVNTTTPGVQRDPWVAALSGGGYVIAWHAFNQDGSHFGIFAQRFDSSGAPQGGEIQVNTTTLGEQRTAVAAGLDAGGFVVVWWSQNQDGSGFGVYSQRYDASGVPQGGETQVNTTTAGDQADAYVASLSDGGYLVVWQSMGQDGSAGGIYARRYDASGTPLGGEMLVNTTTEGIQERPFVAALANGGYLVTWTSFGQDGSGAGIFAQRYGNGLFATEQEALDLKGTMEVGDVDAGSASITVILSVDFGILDVDAGTSGAAVADSGTSSVTITGTLAQINALLSTDPSSAVVYTANGDAPPASATLTLDVDDGGNTGAGGALTASDDETIFITAVNDPPTATIVGPDIAPDGSETEVNTTTADHQQVPAVATLSDGGYVVVWQSNNQDGGGYGIYFQRFDASGAPQGGEVPVNTFAAGDQAFPAVAALADGGYVVAWQSFDQDGSDFGIYAQRYDASGAPQGGEVPVNTTTAGQQNAPIVAALFGGGYIVVWTSADDGSGTGVYAQRYDSSGAPQGGEVRVNTTTANHQSDYAAAALAGGDYVIAWSSLNQDGSGRGVYLQRYDASGVAQGGEILVNTTTSAEQVVTSIAALADGGYVVVWQSLHEGSLFGVYFQRYDASGAPQGGEVRVNTTTAGQQYDASAAALADGGYVVTWQSADQDGSGLGIYSRRYDASGAPLGGEVPVNTTTAGDQQAASVAALPGGGYVVAWASANQDGSGNGIYVQRYDDRFLATEQEALDLKGTIAVSDIDGGGADVTVALSVDHGILEVTAGGSGAVVSGSGTNSVTITGTLAEIEALLDTDPDSIVTFTANTDTPPVSTTLTLEIDDGGHTGSGGALTASDTETIFIAALNDLPVLDHAIADHDSDEDEAVSYQISADAFSDPDGDPLTYSATLANGDPLPEWLDFDSDTRTFSGTPPQDFSGTVELEVTASDGSGSASDAFDLVIAAVNDAPTVTIAPPPLVPDGGEVRANTATAGFQLLPSIAGLSGGGYVVAWQSDGQDGSGYGIYAQRYDADGVAQGGETRVNTFTASSQIEPSVAGLSGGGYVVAWQSFNQDGGFDYGVYVQRYDANGVAQGGETLVNTTTVNQQQSPSVAGLSDGGFVVVWQSRGQDGSSDGIYAQRYDADGVAQGGETLVNTTTANAQLSPAIAALADGGYVITWQSFDQDATNTYGIYAQRFDGNGVAQGAEMLVNTTTASSQFAPSVTGLAGGGYVVTWTSPDDSDNGVYARRFDLNGLPASDETRVNTFTAGGQSVSSVAALLGGGYVVTWSSLAQDGSETGVYAQVFDAAGVAHGGEMRINSTTAGIQDSPSAAALAGGGFVVAWHSNGQDGSHFGVFAQRFSPGYTTTEQVALNLKGTITIGDIDAGGAEITITLSVDYGILNVSVGDSGATVVSGNGTASIVVSGTLAELAALFGAGGTSTVTYTADTDNPPAQALLTVTANDGGSTGADPGLTGGTDDEEGSAQATIAIAPLDDAPVVQAGVADHHSNEDGSVNYQFAADAFAEPDGQSLSYTAALAGGGALPGWLTFNSTTRTFTGTPPSNFNGSFSIAVTASDGSLSVADTFDLVIDPVNDAPTAIIAPLTEAAGGEIRVNTFFGDEQSLPAVAALSGGGYVVVWQSLHQDMDGYGIYAQRYDASGVAQGAETRINTFVGNWQTSPSVAPLSNGGYVVAWQSDLQDGSGNGIYTQRYDADGVAQGAETRVNTFTGAGQQDPSVAALSGGGYVVTWMSTVQDDGTPGIYAQRYDADGVAQGGETRVNTFTANSQEMPSVAGLSGGGYVITWASVQDGGGYGIYAQRYSAGGVAQGVETRVNSFTAGDQLSPAVAGLPGGGYVVVWQSSNQDGSGSGVYAQRYDADGVAQGAETRVNTTIADSQQGSSVAALSGGGYVVSWMSLNQDGSGYGIYAQRYDANGSAQGGETRVNTFTAGNQWTPAIAGLSGGGHVVTWASLNQDGSGYGIYAQRYNNEFVATEQSTLDLKGAIAVADIDAGGGLISVTLSVDYGILNVAAGTSGATAVANSAANVTIFGTLAQVQALLVSDPNSSIGYVAHTDNPPASATLTVTVNDNGNSGSGGPRNDTETATIFITPINDAPSIAFFDNVTFVEDNPGLTDPILLDNGGNSTLADPDSADFDGGTLTLSITSGGVAAEDVLFVDTAGDVSVSGGDILVSGVAIGTWTGGTGGNPFVVTFDEDATLARVQTLMRALVYGNSSQDPTQAARFYSLILTDGDGGTSNVGSGKIDVFRTNDAPSGTDNTITLDEETNAFSVADFGFSDVDGDSLLAVLISTLPTSGSLRLNGSAISSGTSVQASDIAAGHLTYAPAPSASGAGQASFTFQVQDNGGGDNGAGTPNNGEDTDQSANTLTFNFTAANDAPSIAFFDNVTFVEDNPGLTDPILLDNGGNSTLADPDSADFDGGTLTLSITSGGVAAEDVLFVDTAGDVSLSGGDILVSGVAIGTWTGGTGGNPFVVTFDEDATLARVQTLMRALVYGNSSQDPTQAARFYSLILTDGDGGTSNSGSGRIDVFRTNDAPSGTDNTITLDEDSTYAFTAADFGFVDVDGDSLAAVVIASLPGAGTLALDGVAVTEGQEIGAADILAGLLAYTPASNASGGDYSAFTFQVKDNGGSDNGTGTPNNGDDTDQSANTITLDVTAVNDAPVLDLNGAGAGDGSTAGVTEQSGPATLAADLTITDVDDTHLEGATVQITADLHFNDLLSVAGVPNGASGAISWSWDDATGTLAFTGTASVTDYQALLRQVAIEANTDAPGTSRTVTWTLTDGTDASNAPTTAVTVTGLNDPPAITLDGGPSIDGTEDTDLEFSGAEGIIIFDSDLETLTVTLGVDHGTLTLAQTTGLAVTGDGTANVELVGAAADITAALDGLIYRGNLNYEGADTLSIEADDGTATDTAAVAITLADDGRIDGTPGGDDLVGTPQPDNLYGYGGDDDITGLDSDDLIDGGTGADTMAGNGGDDSYFVDEAGDAITELPGEGTDTVHSSITYTLGADLENLVLTGAAAIDGTGNALANTITGNGAANVLGGGEGDDALDGGAGADSMSGGLGDDVYGVDDDGDSVTENADEGTDEIRTTLQDYELGPNVENLTYTGSLGSFSAIGNALANTITGGAASDFLDGGAGDDTLVGLGGTDTYVVDSLADTVVEAVGGGADDRLWTTLAGYTLPDHVEILVGLSQGGQHLTGNALANEIYGQSGSDTLDGGAGADTMVGRAGDDIYVVDNAGDVVTEDAGEGNDEIRTGLASFSIAGLANVENLTGTSTSAQTLTGNAAGNVITAGAAGDTLNGGDGDDTLDGGDGSDRLRGGAGDDTYIVDRAGDQVTELAGGGTDTVQSSVSYSLTAEVENLTLTGTDAIDGTGNALANVIAGNNANNSLNGLAGADTMTGLGGDDTYFVDNVGDQIVEAAAGGLFDLVRSTVSFTLGDNVERLLLLGSASIDGTGNGLANVITGNSGDNRLDGGLGADKLVGKGGNDTYVIDRASDRVVEDAGGGTDTVESSVAYTLPSNVENLILTGAAAIGGTGNFAANTITGNSAANMLNGGAGADTMIGGSGNDIYFADNAGDQAIEEDGGGTDLVRSRVSFTLGAFVENLTLTGGLAIDGTGNDLANVINGNSGANTLDGGTGADKLNGKAGNDTYIVDDAGDQVSEDAANGGVDLVQSSVTFTLGIHVDNLTLTGNAATDGTGNGTANTIVGNAAANSLAGGGGNDELHGGDGDDDLRGGAGNDDLEGGSGADDFIFDTALGAGNVDDILDFAVGNDRIVLENAVFTGLSAGPLSVNAFRAGTSAADADDRIIYDAVTGRLWFDADGTGAAAQILFAVLDNAPPTLSESDFVVI